MNRFPISRLNLAMPFRCVLATLLLFCSTLVFADDPETGNQEPSTETETPQSATTAVDQPPEVDQPPAANQPPPFELSDEVRDALTPLFTAIADAKVSRATVEMLSDTVRGGQVVDSQKSTFQIASAYPNKFTIYLKEPVQRIRVYCDGKTIIAAVAPDAYIRLPQPLSTQAAATSLELPMGPYPEPVFSLTLASVDPAFSFLGGMKSIEIVDHDDYRGKVPAVHLRGVQADDVVWDFWIATGDHPKPLRLLIDLTPMLMASNQVKMPADSSYQVRYDFVAWRMTGEIDAGLFSFKASADAKEYASLEEYYESIAGVIADHPMLGKPAPAFEVQTLDGKTVALKDFAGQVVVLDFWATWCSPCVAAMPVMKAVTDEFKDKGVVFLAFNTGEGIEEIQEFVKQQGWDVKVLIDKDGKVADAFHADAIPQTMVIGKEGAIESVHVGFPGDNELKLRLQEELEILAAGGRIATASQPSEE